MRLVIVHQVRSTRRLIEALSVCAKVEDYVLRPFIRHVACIPPLWYSRGHVPSEVLLQERHKPESNLVRPEPRVYLSHRKNDGEVVTTSSVSCCCSMAARPFV